LKVQVMPRKVKVCEHLARAARLYRRCLELTFDLLETSSLDDEAGLDKLFKERAAVLKKIEEINSSLPVIAGNGRPRLSGVRNQERETAAALLKIIETDVRAIIARDLELKGRLEHEISETARNLSRARQGSRVLGAYSPFRGRVSYYLNKQG